MKLNFSQIFFLIVIIGAAVLMFLSKQPDTQCLWSLLMFVASDHVRHNRQQAGE